MRVLIVSDEEDPYLWDYYRPGVLDGIDLILSAGDLRAEYLSFLVTMAGCPLLYVHGNHDGGYLKAPPEGCECVEDRIATVGGLRILGLGGSVRYSGGPFQYTERQMRRRIRRLWLLAAAASGRRRGYRTDSRPAPGLRRPGGPRPPGLYGVPAVSGTLEAPLPDPRPHPPAISARPEAPHPVR